MDWSTFEQAVIEGTESAYLSLSVRTSSRERSLGRLPLTVKAVRPKLALVSEDCRSDIEAALHEADGGVGDLDEPALRAMWKVARAWAERRVRQADLPVRVRLRTVSGEDLARVTVPKAEVLVDDAEVDDAEVERGRAPDPLLDGFNQLILRSQRVLDDRGLAAQQVRDDQAANMTQARLLLDDQRQMLDVQRQLYERMFESSLRSLREENQRLVSRVSQLETHNAQLMAEFTAAARQVREAGFDADVAAINTKEIGATVREFLELAAKAGTIFMLRDKLSPELLPAMEQFLRADTMELLTDPVVRELLADPAVRELVADKDSRAQMLTMLKSMKVAA